MFRSMDIKKIKHLVAIGGGTKPESIGAWPQIGPHDQRTPCVNVPITFAAEGLAAPVGTVRVESKADFKRYWNTLKMFKSRISR